VTDDWWTVAQFAASAAHTRTAASGTALDRVPADVGRATVALMCSENLWWRCHRRLIADVAVPGRGVPVDHLMPDGRLRTHRPSEEATPGDDGLLHRPAVLR
jgi:uncharacterized protein (DUF488 family)